MSARARPAVCCALGLLGASAHATPYFEVPDPGPWDVPAGDTRAVEIRLFAVAGGDYGPLTQPFEVRATNAPTVSFDASANLVGPQASFEGLVTDPQGTVPAP